MNTEFIKEKRDYIDYIRSIEKNFREMTDGSVSETEAVEFITAALPEAKPCKRNTALWFWMFEEPSELPSDIRVACVYETTYMMSGIIIYALTKYEAVKNIPGIMDVLHKTLLGSMGRGFLGHGFCDLEGFVTAMEIFARSNIHSFFHAYADEFKDFCDFYNGKMELLEELASDRRRGDFGESYADKAASVLELLLHETCPIRVFVYGTLMRGQRAHHYIEDAVYVGEGTLYDYGLYDLGSFPGIKGCSKQQVIGEVYEVSPDMLASMDIYEGEGSLYSRETVCISTETVWVFAYVYVYKSEPEGGLLEGKWGV